MERNDKKIIYVKWGGLGDHLQFSTLPECFHKNGYDTYISDMSEFRSDEIYDMVWNRNPYIKGFSSEKPNCGHVMNIINNKENSMIRNIEITFGVDNHSIYPDIYYTPKKNIEFKNSLLIDINFFSYNVKWDFDVIIKYINNHIKNNNYDNVYFIPPNIKNYSNLDKNIKIENTIDIIPHDIYDYCDIISSIKSVIGINSEPYSTVFNKMSLNTVEKWYMLNNQKINYKSKDNFEYFENILDIKI